MANLRPFHLAIPVDDLEKARHFYGKLLGFRQGRQSERWIDFDMFGHQLVVHLCPDHPSLHATKGASSVGAAENSSNPVDGHHVPIPHFGVIMQFSEWQRFLEHCQKALDDFVIEPHIRFQGQSGQQGTFFFRDPSGNVLEFKGFEDIDNELFRT